MSAPSLGNLFVGSLRSVLGGASRYRQRVPLTRRRFDPPRPVEVEHGGRWWPGMRATWRLCDDGRGCRADVDYVIEHGVGPRRAGTVSRVRPQLSDDI